jgi:antitoxin VapB
MVYDCCNNRSLAGQKRAEVFVWVLPKIAPNDIYRSMSARAKVFMNGRSQAIRLPREFRVSGREVIVERVAGGMLIRDGDPWEDCRAACEGIPDEVFDQLEARNRGLKLEKREFGKSA